MKSHVETLYLWLEEVTHSTKKGLPMGVCLVYTFGIRFLYKSIMKYFQVIIINEVQQ